ncbi:hypothetical protein BOTBODRAFT_150195 [Botryobasidium botryosum FD-172 SS1]|uniref:Glycosyltransferase 61 catalytic domain-containing protein n=1 Tax=Botryobasidium botryosum (strain FD-172 SS1) TaxID=930990 RepID=A0A067N368_BOTB1|nr:hypothetical protein BOTBODRAFT_150195 [Botryobasidium botryosum FD-172 SS1]
MPVMRSLGIRPTRRDIILALLGASSILFVSSLLNTPTVLPFHSPPADPLHHVLKSAHHDPLYIAPGHAAAPAHHQIPVAPRPPRPVSLLGPKKGLAARQSLPPTKIKYHAAGWTLFTDIYMSNGTFFIVTDDRSKFPDIRMITSTGLPADSVPGNIEAREPTPENMDFLTPELARRRWEDRVWVVEGTTLLYNDPKQFINHYYHFAAELFMGTWRMLSGLDPNINIHGETVIQEPQRAIFAHTDTPDWKDYTGFNQYYFRAFWPSIGLETSTDWADRINLTSQGTKAWRFPLLLFVDRSASFRDNLCGGITQRTVALAVEATKDRSSTWWWEPVRRSVLRFAGVEQEVMDLNVKFAAPEVGSLHSRDGESGGGREGEKEKGEGGEGGSMVKRQRQTGKDVVVTYISRQGWRRRLIEENHTELVKELTDLCARKGWELNVIKPEELSQDQQLALAARTTIMLGVHGNGLTHLLMMPTTPISTVIEIFYPGGYARDYEWTAGAIGIQHYAIWNDTYITGSDRPAAVYPEGFQGTSIPVHGVTVAKLIEDRIGGLLP